MSTQPTLLDDLVELMKQHGYLLGKDGDTIQALADYIQKLLVDELEAIMTGAYYSPLEDIETHYDKIIKDHIKALSTIKVPLVGSDGRSAAHQRKEKT